MEVYTCDSVSYVICRNLTFLMLDLVASGAQWQMFLPTELAAVHAVTASDNALRVNAQNGQLTINNPQGHTFQVFDTDGRLLHQSSATSCTLSLPAAPYVVKSGKEVKKVSVR